MDHSYILSPLQIIAFSILLHHCQAWHGGSVESAVSSQQGPRFDYQFTCLLRPLWLFVPKRECVCVCLVIDWQVVKDIFPAFCPMSAVIHTSRPLCYYFSRKRVKGWMGLPSNCILQHISISGCILYVHRDETKKKEKKPQQTDIHYTEKNRSEITTISCPPSTVTGQGRSPLFSQWMAIAKPAACTTLLLHCLNSDCRAAKIQ